MRKLNNHPNTSKFPLREQIGEVVREAVRAELSNHRPQPEALLDSKQARAWLNISPRKLDEIVAAGKLRPLRIGRKRLFPVAQVEGFLRECAR